VDDSAEQIAKNPSVPDPVGSLERRLLDAVYGNFLLMVVLAASRWVGGEDLVAVMPSATMPTTVATGIRSLRMQRTPAIYSARTVICSSVIALPLRPQYANHHVTTSSCKSVWRPL
jgi:hypothetical protein